MNKILAYVLFLALAFAITQALVFLLSPPALAAFVIGIVGGVLAVIAAEAVSA